MRQLAIALAAILTLGLSACGGEAGSAQPTAAPTEEPSAAPTLSAADRAACAEFDSSTTEIRKVIGDIEAGKKVVPFLAATYAETAAEDVRSGAAVASTDLGDAMEQTAASLDLLADDISEGDVSLSLPAFAEADDAVTEACEVS